MDCERQWRIIGDVYRCPDIEQIRGPYTDFVLTFLTHARNKLAESEAKAGTLDDRPQDVEYFQRMEAYFLSEMGSLGIDDPNAQSENMPLEPDIIQT